jgi:hypothetical protein
MITPAAWSNQASGTSVIDPSPRGQLVDAIPQPSEAAYPAAGGAHEGIAPAP